MEKTRNAANPEAVKASERKAKRTREVELEDLRAVLSTVEGRRVMWRILEHCSVFGSIWEPSARIHYLAGKQDVGHYLLTEIGQAKEEFIFQMMKEAKGEKDNG